MGLHGGLLSGSRTMQWSMSLAGGKPVGSFSGNTSWKSWRRGLMRGSSALVVDSWVSGETTQMKNWSSSSGCWIRFCAEMAVTGISSRGLFVGGDWKITSCVFHLIWGSHFSSQGKPRMMSWWGRETTRKSIFSSCDLIGRYAARTALLQVPRAPLANRTGIFDTWERAKENLSAAC